MIFLLHSRGDLTQRQWKILMLLLPAQKLKTDRPSKDHRTIISSYFVLLTTIVS